MFARLQSHGVPPTTPPPRPAITDVLRDHVGYCGAYVLADVDGATRTLVSLWATEEDALRAPERTRARYGGERPFDLRRDEVCEVIGDDPGSEPDTDPRAAVLVTFDGPVSTPAFDAGRRAHDGRIRPVWRSMPGTVRLLALWERTARCVHVLHLGTSREALERTATAVGSQELLPDEDPALLTGADRREILAVDECAPGAADGATRTAVAR